ncbi:MAG: V-type ATPase subunit [Defluviitaleaceae bacterium]|nr:V-type ATPase subunit [Defluviitaleaceae bacterium]
MKAVVTKIKARRERLLTRDDYMAACRRGQQMAAPPPLAEDIRMIGHYIKGVVFPIEDKPCRESLKRVRGMELDLRNILWIWRLKTFHGVDGDAVFPFLSPHRYRLGVDEIRRMAHARSAQEFSQIVGGTVYDEVFGGEFSKGGVTALLGEQALARAVTAQYRRESRHCDFALIYSYLYARSLEIKNIGAINEGLQRGLSDDDIFLHLYV